MQFIIISPETGKKFSIYSKQDISILKKYLSNLKTGGGKCSICGSNKTTKSSCPLNPKAKKPNPKKHPKALGVVKKSRPARPARPGPDPAKRLKCKGLKKTKNPKCENQRNCKWVKKIYEKVLKRVIALKI